MRSNTSSIHLKFGAIGLIVIFSLILTTQFTYAQDPSQDEGPGSGLTPGEAQGGTVESALSGGADTQDIPSYNGCVYVWDVWTENNLGITGTFEPGDWIYFYMAVDNDCYPYVNPSTLFWWQVWSPGNVSEISDQYYFTVYYGTGNWWLEAQFPTDPPMGEWLYKGTTAYYGGTNSDTRTFKVVPKDPSGVSASDGTYTDKVRVTWSASSGATSYDVYRATSSGGTYSLIGSSASTSFDDTTATPGTTYWYEVRGCVSVGCGGYSNYDSGWRNTGAPPSSVAVADFDGDGDTDVSVFRSSNGRWYMMGQSSVSWALTGDLPVPGDYNGDGTTDIAIYRPSNGKWFVKDQGSTSWGFSGDIPVQADYDGDGSTEIAVLRPSNGRWYIQGVGNFSWYQSGDIPVPCDYDGDGADEIAVFRPSNNKWYVMGSSPVSWAQSGDIPVPADYDGDGSCDIAVYRPSTGNWYVQGSSPISWGHPDDIPVPGDYDGDGATEIAILRPSNGRWYIQGVGNFSWYFTGDYPLPVRDTNADGDVYE